jgi:threonyl-tRNA synthetase
MDIHSMRHSAAHLLAAAVQKHFPDAQFGVGPVVEHGFYYDMLLPRPLTPEDVAMIQASLDALIAADLPFTREEWSLDQAIAYFDANAQPFKVELLRDLQERGTTSLRPEEAEGLGADKPETASVYKTGDVFLDLCRGPHVERSSQVGAVALTKISGAYWRGKEENPMLQRVYGLCFATKEELAAHQTMLVEAEKRDHRKLGKELKLFTISELVGSGLPLFQPRGAAVRKALEEYLWDLHKDKGYERVWTPHLAKEDLYMTSGHGKHYLADMFSVHGGTSKESFYVKPMNCPHHMQIFADNAFSYRDMPIRYFEPATVYRDEKTGQLGGLTRVRSITQDDGHLFCRVSQLGEEVATIVSIIERFYATMGMLDGYRVRLSLRGDDHAQYLGSDAVWEQAEGALRAVCQERSLPYFEGKGEAAFYGPKLDFMFKDAIGREHQLATVQCDFNLPERFNLSFVNEGGEDERPVVIHRAISGSIERFMGVMIEHFAGAFPLWLAPVQVRVASVGEAHIAFAEEQVRLWRKAGLRVEADVSSATVGAKIRDAAKAKVPLTIIAGEKEVSGQAFSVRVFGEEAPWVVEQVRFVEEVLARIAAERVVE